MGLLDEALSQLLIGRRRPPTSFDEVVEAFGDLPRRQNPQIARALTGLAGPLPPRGTPQRRAYDSALRRVDRWRTTAAERRRPSAASLAQLRDLARRRLAEAAAGRVLQRGARMRLTATIRVSQVWKTHTMPADAGGRPRLQLIVGAEMAPAVNSWLEGDLDAAGAELLAAFFTAYWGDPEPAQIGHIVRVELRE